VLKKNVWRRKGATRLYSLGIYPHMSFLHNNIDTMHAMGKGKGEAIPVTGGGGP
jgi:hypothetical protein